MDSDAIVTNSHSNAGFARSHKAIFLYRNFTISSSNSRTTGPNKSIGEIQIVDRGIMKYSPNFCNQIVSDRKEVDPFCRKFVWLVEIIFAEHRHIVHIAESF